MVQCRYQRRVVVHPQIALEPHQRAGGCGDVRSRHGADSSKRRPALLAPRLKTPSGVQSKADDQLQPQTHKHSARNAVQPQASVGVAVQPAPYMPGKVAQQAKQQGGL